MSEKETQRHVDSSDVKPPDYKLLIDPLIRKGEERLVRYNGESYNTENHGQGVVIIRDPRPRMNRLWSRRERCDMPVPRYKVDEWYIGAVPPREITFSKLNDNITKQFMEKMCSKFGKLERVRVYYHPKTQKHMGLSKVVFTSMKSAGECVKKLHNTSIMGNIIHAQIDSKGELLNKMYQRIARGEMVAETIPDVIRHTQDGMSMSNKFKEKSHRHHHKDGSRRLSQEDPRRSRRSVEEAERNALRRHHRKESIKEEDESTDSSYLPGHRGKEKIASTYELTNNNTVKNPISSNRDDCHSEIEHQPVDLDSRISSLLQEDVIPKTREPARLPERHQEKELERVSTESQDEVNDHVSANIPVPQNNIEPDVDHRLMPHSNSAPDIPSNRYDDRLRYDRDSIRDDIREHSPHYRHRHEDMGMENQNFRDYRRHEYDRDRDVPRGGRYFGRPGYDRGYYNNCDDDYHHRRPEPRRVYSPPRGPYRHNHVPPPRYRHPSPERFNHPGRYSPLHIRADRYRRSRSPEHWRRSPGYHPGGDAQHMDRERRSHHGRSPSPLPHAKQEVEPHKPASRRTSVDLTKLSLDQRLQEITGEASGQAKKKKKDLVEDELQDDDSVDMEISEGESDSDAKTARQQVPQFDNVNSNPNSVPTPVPDTWHANGPTWNSHGVPGFDGRMWGMPPQDFHKGFERNPQLPAQFQINYPGEAWPSHFQHPVVPPGMMPPFNFPPFDSYHMMGRVMNQDPQLQKDEDLCQVVLSAIVEDLKSTVSRDLNRKVVETMAFKVYESWWDENINAKSVVKTTPVSSQADKVQNNEKPDATQNTQLVSDNKADAKLKNPSLLNAFDPLNWAKNSFEMDGFRIGLGLRSAISKMPSFRVKKRPRIPSPTKEDIEETLKKKAKKADGKENQEQMRVPPKKKHQRITVLDSDGEDERSDGEESYTESFSDRESKTKSNVLNVDEVFSESSESSAESSSDDSEKSSEDESSESESEDEVLPLVDKSKDRKLIDTLSEKEPIQALIEKDPETSERAEESVTEPKAISDFTSESRTSTESDGTNTVEDSNISSLLSPTALGVTPNTITPQQLRHIHPKKRHRLISHDQFEPFAKIQVTDKLKDDLSHITEKERAVLEALTDMHKTPERRLTTDSDTSHVSLPDKLLSPPAKPEIQNAHPTSSQQNELDAVQALLSFKGTGAQSPVKKKPSVRLKHKNKITLAQITAVSCIAEEHNYFTPSDTTRPLPTTGFEPAQVFDEHNYSRATWEDAESDLERPASPLSVSTLSAAESVYNFKDDLNDSISAAERVKLRREKPSKFEKQTKRAPADLRFTPRSKVEEFIVAYEMWCSGLDLEDMKFLRKVYEKQLEDPNAPRWVNDSHWVPHPITATVSPKKSKSKRSRRKDRNADDNLEIHTTGSARTEGYYKLEDMEKLRQRREMYGKGESQATSSSLKMAKTASNSASDGGAGCSTDKNIGSRETRHFMRRIAAEVGSDVGDLFKYNQLMFRKKAVKFKRSSIHGWGLFAEEPIGADEMVIEYVGQVVRTLIAERREVNYTKLGIGSSYLFRIDTEHIIDATKCGNYARFMNHSCNPSCYAKVITVDTAKKIVIYSKGPIKKSQEITYDYKFPLEDDKVMCFCGAENCRRTLN